MDTDRLSRLRKDLNAEARVLAERKLAVKELQSVKNEEAKAGTRSTKRRQEIESLLKEIVCRERSIVRLNGEIAEEEQKG